MKTSEPRRNFRSQLLRWYDLNRRDLPWRKNRNPYRVWLSEIMLQQTRVNAVIEHYHRFLERFPSIEKLAGARLPSVLAAWSGLGYYRRARMLHAAAKEVVKNYGGELPSTVLELRALPGIGRYTAAAIASIAFEVPAAVVDGNVERVLERVLGRNLAGEPLWQEAEALLDREHPGDFNQAMMELGATVCVPGVPQCDTCPVFKLCATRGKPDREAKSIRQNKREIHYALSCRKKSVFLVKRPSNVSLMAGMWELPEAPDETTEPLFRLRHSITTTDYTVLVQKRSSPQGIDGTWVPTSRLANVPLTGLARKILREAGLA